jgi:hypothetical protein
MKLTKNTMKAVESQSLNISLSKACLLYSFWSISWASSHKFIIGLSFSLSIANFKINKTIQTKSFGTNKYSDRICMNFISNLLKCIFTIWERIKSRNYQQSLIWRMSTSLLQNVCKNLLSNSNLCNCLLTFQKKTKSSAAQPIWPK